ncbi:SipW-dependent-type signal peptide-containing protein [Gordonia sp. C13]|uniref:SipW-dependent-type signal peptide-containing protein n=1 Tax=Gordonia sp. C13 TaxID=2935078 RepID=UPI00200B08BA|nr:SipW-dependent-type signal peptide-containing protein [Gordonia sp. C13]MCK8614997.1 SipW-dependent-type signal peptide-containing protein [Gordonia sp. C13]
MTNNQTPTSAPLTDEERNRKSRKRKAILASGAVLGVGAVVTLAAWNDTVFGAGTFGIGNTAWNVQASVDGTNFDEYADSAAPGVISFPVVAGVNPINLMPGQTTKGSFWLKETKGFMDADVTIQAPANATNTLAQALYVTIKDGSTTLVNNKQLSASGISTTFRVTKATAKKIDFEVTLPANANPNLLVDTSVTPRWEMKAQSVDNP